MTSQLLALILVVVLSSRVSSLAAMGAQIGRRLLPWVDLQLRLQYRAARLLLRRP